MFSKLCEPLPELKRPRQGGWRQQLRASDEARASQVAPRHLSHLASGHLRDFFDGDISATKLRYHCQNAAKDGLSHPMVIRIANIATESAEHKCLEGIMTLLESCGIPQLLTPIPGNEATTLALLPSTLIDCLQNFYPREFTLRLGADRAKIRKFWKINECLMRLFSDYFSYCTILEK